jgi:hypothetical protein
LALDDTEPAAMAAMHVNKGWFIPIYTYDSFDRAHPLQFWQRAFSTTNIRPFETA